MAGWLVKGGMGWNVEGRGGGCVQYEYERDGSIRRGGNKGGESEAVYGAL